MEKDIFEGSIVPISLVVMLPSIEGINNVKFSAKLPDGSDVEWTNININVAQRKLKYIPLTPWVAGRYKVQPYFEIGDFKGYGTTVTFDVYKKFT